MQKNTLSVFIALCMFAFLYGCGGGGNDPGPDTPAHIDVASGFSTAYLTGKTFYTPITANNTNFIQEHLFTSTTVSWRDNFFNIEDSATYSIISANGINGVITYFDGVYDLFYSVQSVTNDRLMVCYTYQGITSVATCSANNAVSWYFDRAVAEANYP